MSIPTAIAVGRSVMIVKREVATHAAVSMRGTFINWSTSCQFVMLKTLDKIIAEITGSGMNRKRGAIRSRDPTRKTACRVPAIGGWAPTRTLAIVWEETPEAGSPPAKAEATF